VAVVSLPAGVEGGVGQQEHKTGQDAFVPIGFTKQLSRQNRGWAHDEPCLMMHVHARERWVGRGGVAIGSLTDSGFWHFIDPRKPGSKIGEDREWKTVVRS